MLNAFEKQSTAIVPTNANPAIANKINSTDEKLWIDNPLNIPRYIKNSLINPLKGGSPQIAIEPIRNNTAVFGIDLIKPPKSSIFLV